MLNSLIEGSGFYMAICLAIFSFLMPIFISEFRKSMSIMVAYWFVVFLHQIVAFLNTYLFAVGEGGTVGSWDDANRGFHFVARELALNGEYYYNFKMLSVPISLDSFTNGGIFYYEMLGSVYKWFGVSHLLGGQLSILVFAFSCIILVKLLRLLELGNYSVSSLIFYGAMPSTVLLGAITLREPYEVLFFMLAVYFGIRISFNEKLSIPCAFFMIVSALIMGVFHKALMIYAVCLIFLFLVWSCHPLSRLGNVKKLHLISLVVVPVFLIFVIVVTRKGFIGLEYLDKILKIVNGENLIFDNLYVFRERSLSMFTRATYGLNFDDSSPFAMIYSSINIYIHYLFAPFPWQVKSFNDICGALEALIRMILIIFSVSGWWKAVGLQKRMLGVMILLYFTVTFLWAVGTTNYGTAIRHHMHSWWILTVAGVPSLLQWLNRLKVNLLVHWSSRFLRAG